MRVSGLIKKLSEIQEANGDIIVCTLKRDIFWGCMHNELNDNNIQCVEAQPKGPKSTETELAVIIGT
jgi:hypothetical protein